MKNIFKLLFILTIGFSTSMLVASGVEKEDLSYLIETGEINKLEVSSQEAVAVFIQANELDSLQTNVEVFIVDAAAQISVANSSTLLQNTYSLLGDRKIDRDRYKKITYYIKDTSNYNRYLTKSKDIKIKYTGVAKIPLYRVKLA